MPENHVAVAFSGGIDSTLLSVLCRDLGKQVTLVTVGFPQSHDVSFSRAIAQSLGLPQVLVGLDEESFSRDLTRIRTKITCGNSSHIENCLAYYYLARAVREMGLELVASANGCDELFCGYNGYREIFTHGESEIINFMNSKIENELILVQEMSSVASEFSVQIRQPFLASRFIEFAKKIPIDQKILGPDDMIRKHILRKVALSLGVPEESALKPKKALQYGSLIHKYYKRSQGQKKKN